MIDEDSSSSTPRVAQALATDPVHKQFHKAVREGQHRTRLEHLYAQGANVDTKDFVGGLTALHYAAFRGDLDIARFLLKHGADANAKHQISGTPIFVAALRGHADVVELLLEHKADMSTFALGLGTPMHCACFGGNPAIVRTMVSHHRPDIGRDTVIHIDAMSTIADTGLLPDKYGKLLWRGLSMNGSGVRCSPVLLAADRCHFQTLQVLSDDLRASKGETNRHILDDTWEIAIEADGRTLWPSSIGATTSYDSVQSKSGPSYASKASTSSAWSFLGYPQPTSAAPSSTLLMWAAASLKLDLIEYLLEAGAVVNAKDKRGRTALHYAASPFDNALFKDIKMCVQRLVEAGAVVTEIDCDTTTQAPETPLRLTADPSHAALDPRNCSKWGVDIHSRCLASILDHMTSGSEKRKASREALLSIASYNVCPADSVDLLCKNILPPLGDAVKSAKARRCFTLAMHRGLKAHAADALISTLLSHGADPNDGSQRLPLISAIHTEASHAVVLSLLHYGADPNKADRTESHTTITPYEVAISLKKQDLIALFNHVIETAGVNSTESKSDEPTASVAYDGSEEEADEPDVQERYADTNRVANLTRKLSRRSWFPGLATFPLSRFRRDNRMK